MASSRTVPVASLAESNATLTLQWQTAMERLKHFEILVGTGLGLFLAALGYSLSQVLVESQHPTEREYWSVVFVLIVLCVCQLHVVDRVSDAAEGVIKLEAASQGALTYLSDVTDRITWTASLGFLTAFVAPAFSVVSIVFLYRNLASDPFYPIIVMVVSSLVFFAFAVALLRHQRTIIATVRASRPKAEGGGGSKSQQKRRWQHGK